MLAFLGHVDTGPIMYGLLMALGIYLLWLKLIKFQILSLATSLGVFWLVFALHGGTMAGGFSAMIAALAFDLIIFPPWRKS